MRISTTTIEAFRLWKDPEQEWMTEADLIGQIRGEYRPTEKMILGTAYGQVIETPAKFAAPDPLGTGVPGYHHYLERRDRPGDRTYTHYFSADTMQPALDLFDYEHGLFEVKAVKEYLPGIDVVAKCDYVLGACLDENKTTDDTPDFDKYYASAQWRFMLDIFGAAKCTYNVFQLGVDRDDVVSLKDVVRFPLYTYPALEQDCRSLLEEFVAYVRLRKLDGHLRQKQRDAA